MGSVNQADIAPEIAVSLEIIQRNMQLGPPLVFSLEFVQ